MTDCLIYLGVTIFTLHALWHVVLFGVLGYAGWKKWEKWKRQ